MGEARLRERAMGLAAESRTGLGQPWPFYKDLKLIGAAVGGLLGGVAYIGAGVACALVPGAAAFISPEVAATFAGGPFAAQVVGQAWLDRPQRRVPGAIGRASVWALPWLAVAMTVAMLFANSCATLNGWAQKAANDGIWATGLELADALQSVVERLTTSARHVRVRSAVIVLDVDELGALPDAPPLEIIVECSRPVGSLGCGFSVPDAVPGEVHDAGR